MIMERFVTEYETPKVEPFGYRYHCGVKIVLQGKQYGILFYTNKPPGKREWNIAEEDLRLFAQSKGES
jgi:hypothetical protein